MFLLNVFEGANVDADNSDVKVAVLGTGANGTAIAVDLARRGYGVTLIDQWPANVNAVRSRGAVVECEGERTVTTVEILHLSDLATLPQAAFDVVLLVVKAYDTAWACRLIEPHLAPDGCVVGVQNGMTVDAIAAVVGDHRAVGAVIEITSAMYEPGIVERHSGHARSWFAVGADHPDARAWLPSVAEMLGAVGVVEIADDILSAKWMKLILNAAELVPSAVLGLSIADCARQPGMREVMLAAGDEAVRAAMLQGARLRPIFGMSDAHASRPEQYVATVLDELLAHYVKPHSRATVLQDWMKGRRSEVQEINGEVIRVMERHAMDAPVNRAVVRLALDIEAGRATPSVTHAFDLIAATPTEAQ